MRMFLKLTCLMFIITQLASCTPKPPYEIKSPCVSIDTYDPAMRNPCVRRPANVMRDIT